MLRHLGYVAIALSLDATTNRTCRVRNASPERLRELVRSNLDGLKKVIRFNAKEGIHLYRISSLVIPLASHPVNDLRWWNEFSHELREIGALIRRSRMRVSMHPGQFTVLNSRDPEVVAASRAEIEWHVRFLEALETETDSKIVIHLGGAYGSKFEAIRRFAKVVGDLPANWRDRLVIENDERIFTVEDVLEASRLTGLPVVFDWLHHLSNPGSGATFALLREVFDTWKTKDGPPKLHLSSQLAGGRLGAHADYVDLADAAELLRIAPDHWFDCMLEAKKKDLALFQLRDDLCERGLAETACFKASGVYSGNLTGGVGELVARGR